MGVDPDLFGRRRPLNPQPCHGWVADRSQNALGGAKDLTATADAPTVTFVTDTHLSRSCPAALVAPVVLAALTVLRATHPEFHVAVYLAASSPHLAHYDWVAHWPSRECYVRLAALAARGQGLVDEVSRAIIGERERPLAPVLPLPRRPARNGSPE